MLDDQPHTLGCLELVDVDGLLPPPVRTEQPALLRQVQERLFDEERIPLSFPMDDAHEGQGRVRPAQACQQLGHRPLVEPLQHQAIRETATHELRQCSFEGFGHVELDVAICRQHADAQRAQSRRQVLQQL